MFNIYAFIEFDSSSKGLGNPFEVASNVWDLTEDLSLWGCKDMLFITAISGVGSCGQNPPLVDLRGLPENTNRAFERIRHDDFVGWLFLSEILACLDHQNVDQSQLANPVVVLLRTLHVLATIYGDERVRLVFSVTS